MPNPLICLLAVYSPNPLLSIVMHIQHWFNTAAPRAPITSLAGRWTSGPRSSMSARVTANSSTSQGRAFYGMRKKKVRDWYPQPGVSFHAQEKVHAPAQGIAKGAVVVVLPPSLGTDYAFLPPGAIFESCP